MRVSFEAESKKTSVCAETYYYCIPALLSIESIGTPVITEVRGTTECIYILLGHFQFKPS